MTVLDTDVRHVQNEAITGLLQWRFVSGFQTARADEAACPLPLVFLVAPVLLNEDSAGFVRHTQRQSGLRAFAAKFLEGQFSASDHLLAIHDRTQAMRDLSLAGLSMAVASGLMSIDVGAATALALSRTVPRVGLPPSVRALVSDAHKFGDWCAALTLHEIAGILKVRF